MCEEFGHFQMVGIETTVKILSGVNGRVYYRLDLDHFLIQCNRLITDSTGS
jgi:hypothetical protein